MTAVERKKAIARFLLRALARWSPETFTTDAYARDADGCSVDPHSSSACRWCIHGLLETTPPEPGWPGWPAAVDAIATELGIFSSRVDPRPLSKVNDGPDGYEILRGAIESAARKLEAA